MGRREVSAWVKSMAGITGRKPIIGARGRKTHVTCLRVKQFQSLAGGRLCLTVLFLLLPGSCAGLCISGL